jgi:hypothetical protein
LPNYLKEILKWIDLPNLSPAVSRHSDILGHSWTFLAHHFSVVLDMLICYNRRGGNRNRRDFTENFIPLTKHDIGVHKLKQRISLSACITYVWVVSVANQKTYSLISYDCFRVSVFFRVFAELLLLLCYGAVVRERGSKSPFFSCASHCGLSSFPQSVAVVIAGAGQIPPSAFPHVWGLQRPADTPYGVIVKHHTPIGQTHQTVTDGASASL